MRTEYEESEIITQPQKGENKRGEERDVCEDLQRAPSKLSYLETQI
jgi:hypothetical protein